MKSQQVVFSEGFGTSVTNATNGTSSQGIAWEATCPDCSDSNDYFKVNSQRKLENRDSNGPSFFITDNIPVPQNTDFDFDMVFSSSGTMESADECNTVQACAGDPDNPTSLGCDNCWDFLRVQIFSSGGTEIYDYLVPDSQTLENGGSVNFSGNTGSNTALYIKVTAQTWANKEKIFIDDLFLRINTPLPDAIVTAEVNGVSQQIIDGVLQVCNGDRVVLTGSWPGHPNQSSLTHNWNINFNGNSYNVPVSTFNIDPVGNGWEAPQEYHVVDGNGNSRTIIVSLDVLDAPNAGTPNVTVTGCEISESDLYDGLDGEDSGGVWTFGGMPVVFPVTNSGTYTYTVSGCGPDSSANVQVQVRQTPIPSSPSLRNHYIMCEGQASSFSHWGELSQILTNYDISLILDNGDGVYQEGVDTVKYDIFLEDNSILASDLAVLVQSFSLQTGDYFIIVYDNDKGGFPLNNVDTGDDNTLNEDYNGCEYFFPTKLTVYNSRDGLLGLSPSMVDNTICLTDTRSFYLTLDGNSHSDGFILYEETSQNNAYGNPISYQSDAYGAPILYNYQFEVVSQTPLVGYTEVIDDVATNGAMSIVGAGAATVKLTIYTPHPDGSINTYCNKVMTIDIIVVEGPDPGNITGDNSICENETSTYSSSVNGGVWSIDSSTPANIATINSSTGLLTPTADGDVVIKYTVSGSGGCSDESQIYSVTIKPLPIINNINYTP